MKYMQYEKRIVCFIDILGFSNIIKRTIRKTSSEDTTLFNIVQAIQFIHTHFEGIEMDYEGTIQLSQFSDSIVISFTTENSYEKMTTIFKNLKYVQVQLLKEYGILLRGGVVIGDVIHNDSLLLGPAMIDAYMLESKCAMSPRIVIDPKVIYRYKKIAVNNPKDKEPSVNKDLDDTYYIDYFNFKDTDFFVDGEPHEYYRKICEIVRDNVNSSDISIRVKYLWIRNKLKECDFFKDVSYRKIYKQIITNREK